MASLFSKLKNKRGIRLVGLVLFVGLALTATLGATGKAPETKPGKFVAHAPSLTPLATPLPEKSPVVVVETVKTVKATTAAPKVSVVSSPTTSPINGLLGVIGYARAGGNCVNEPGVKRQNGNPSSWAARTQTPYIGATALWTFNHTGVVTGIWSNGDIEVRHQNWSGGNMHRFPRSAFRGFI